MEFYFNLHFYNVVEIKIMFITVLCARRFIICLGYFIYVGHNIGRNLQKRKRLRIGG